MLKWWSWQGEGLSSTGLPRLVFTPSPSFSLYWTGLEITLGSKHAMLPAKLLIFDPVHRGMRGEFSYQVPNNNLMVSSILVYCEQRTNLNQSNPTDGA